MLSERNCTFCGERETRGWCSVCRKTYCDAHKHNHTDGEMEIWRAWKDAYEQISKEYVAYLRRVNE